MAVNPLAVYANEWRIMHCAPRYIPRRRLATIKLAVMNIGHGNSSRFTGVNDFYRLSFTNDL